MDAKTSRRIVGGCLVVAGAVLMWVSTEALGGILLMSAGIGLEILGITLEHR